MLETESFLQDVLYVVHWITYDRSWRVVICKRGHHAGLRPSTCDISISNIRNWVQKDIFIGSQFKKTQLNSNLIESQFRLQNIDFFFFFSFGLWLFYPPRIVWLSKFSKFWYLGYNIAWIQ